MSSERSFIMVKPDGVNRGLIADIIKRFEQKGFKLVAMKFMKVLNFILSTQNSIKRSNPCLYLILTYLLSYIIFDFRASLNLYYTNLTKYKLVHRYTFGRFGTNFNQLLIGHLTCCSRSAE